MSNPLLRYWYERQQLADDKRETRGFAIWDRRSPHRWIAQCEHVDVAEKLVKLLNEDHDRYVMREMLVDMVDKIMPDEMSIGTIRKSPYTKGTFDAS
jgi:hypothetical protein